ncbi:malonyl-CoA decarboxylase domain-containing protein [Alkalilimnicola ehrlichii MLHE-1]|uniref:Malonyl-CoA decarboxylase n=1 Tax=Alkalilimnicola ehrlichii (strain ATCC BAA-1101 / DSM 17681 / MLHE-1) TaxID=187272 RepID=Q0A4W2_ALKEH|nr:malonyl-CoA decarboxylase [Alkalilimnicola ehrlichii]ABI58125.1 Malonyl-CoA decarboxylase [Alkalilimnicola ehrlichii MLHE-1]
MRNRWWNRLVDQVADRGLGLSRLNQSPDIMERLEENCRALLTSRGEASGVALAREVVRAVDSLDEAGKTRFLKLLAHRFGPDREAVLAAAERFRESDEPADLQELLRVVEPPRQEVFRRLNGAPDGTRVLVRLRETLLRQLKDNPDLGPVNTDFQHLLKSWFNPGFLQLQRISWDRSPARLMEKLIQYESVHAIQGWDDLRRRLAADRRCFGFFHPALPDEPLIFVEVALVQGLATHTAPLLAPDAPVVDTREADTAIFFSISNCQVGLRGVSFGNFLLKQVMGELISEFPHVERYATLSPIPGFSRALRMEGDYADGFTRERIAALLQEDAEALTDAAGVSDPVAALYRLLEAPLVHADVLAAPMRRLVQAYLTRVRRNDTVADPVARFHLSNGARLEQVNAFSDHSATRLQASYGMMVNYRYIAEAVEENHERFVKTGEVVLSRALQKQQKRINAAWDGVAVGLEGARARQAE